MKYMFHTKNDSDSCKECSMFKHQNKIGFSKCNDLCVFHDDNGVHIVMFEEKKIIK